MSESSPNASSIAEKRDFGKTGVPRLRTLSEKQAKCWARSSGPRPTVTARSLARPLRTSARALRGIASNCASSSLARSLAKLACLSSILAHSEAAIGPRNSTVDAPRRTVSSSAARHKAATCPSSLERIPPPTEKPLETSARPNRGEWISVSGSQPCTTPPCSLTRPSACWPVPRSTALSQAGRWKMEPRWSATNSSIRVASTASERSASRTVRVMASGAFTPPSPVRGPSPARQARPCGPRRIHQAGR